MKRALLVMVHGTPRPESNGDMYRVVDRVRGSGRFEIVEVGFLDLNEPDIPTAIERCVAAGASEIAAVPYFLHSGRHVTRDLPHLLDDASQRHPDVKITMGDFIGSRPEITRALTDRFREALKQLRD